MRRPAGLRQEASAAPENAGVSPRPGVARTDLATPPGEVAPLAGGAGSQVTPTPTRPRGIVPLPEAASGLAESLPRRHGWRIDDINGAPDAETALRRMFEWARAELAKCERNRPQDADGFRWHLIHKMAPLVAGIYKNHAAPEFLAHPPLRGGGWVPRQPKARKAEARPPGGRR